MAETVAWLKCGCGATLKPPRDGQDYRYRLWRHSKTKRHQAYRATQPPSRLEQFLNAIPAAPLPGTEGNE